MVTTTDQEGNMIEITNQQDMEEAILSNNHKKFLQSTHTPFYLSPLKDNFGFKGLNTASQAVLAGVYDSNHDLDQRILDVIAQCLVQNRRVVPRERETNPSAECRLAAPLSIYYPGTLVSTHALEQSSRA